MKLILNPQYGLYERNGQAFCDSLQVAETFDKEHYNVIRDIEGLDCSKEFNALNFEAVKYKDKKGEKRPKYLMTKDGFTFLVFGYRGKKAAKFKEDYIRRFNEMEKFLESLLNTKIEFPAFTEAISESHAAPKPYHYSNEINMIYRIVLGYDAKKFRERLELEKGVVIKPYLTTAQIQAVEKLQRVDIGLMEAGLSSEERKEILTRKYERMLMKISA